MFSFRHFLSILALVTALVPAAYRAEAVTQNQNQELQPREEQKPAPVTAVGKRVARVEGVPGKYVALTFDDGPSATLTPRVLDILKANNARGTFFVLGRNAAAHKDILRRAEAEGSEIGVHTWSHPQLTRLSAERVHDEISRTVNVIEQALGHKPVVMRPPYGASNAALVNNIFDNYGMRSILWDVDTLDWKHHNPARTVEAADKHARSGSIILVHDIHATTVDAIDALVKTLQAKGYTFVTVSDLIQMAESGTDALVLQRLRNPGAALAGEAAAPSLPQFEDDLIAEAVEDDEPAQPAVAAASVPAPAAPGAAAISGAPSIKPTDAAKPVSLPAATPLPDAEPIAAKAKKIQVSLPSLPEPPTLIKAAPVQSSEDSLTRKSTDQEMPALPPACELPPLFLDNDNMVY
ncbi:MAG: polysaccharide deacetylase family protein [Akkermansia muciniphila]